MPWNWNAQSTLLRKYDTNAEDSPGAVRFIVNKGADQNNIVNPENSDGTEHMEVRLLNSTGSPLTKGRPYIVQPTGASATGPNVIVPTAVATAQRLICFASTALVTATWGWFHCAGWSDLVLTDGSGTSIASADALKCAPGTSTVALLKDAGALETISTVAFAGAASTLAATAIRAYIIGAPRVINT